VMAAQWRKGMLQKSKKENDRLIEFLEELSPKVLAKLLVRVSQQYEHDINAAEETAMTACAENEVLSVPSRRSNISTKVNINLPVQHPSFEMNHDQGHSKMPIVHEQARHNISVKGSGKYLS
jgi:hypothetical protein